MVMARGDKATLDLLSWEPPELVERYDEKLIRAASLRSRITKAVSETLKQSSIPREEIAAAMSDWLGEDVSKHMLDAYSSEAREEQTIPVLRLMALIQATGDLRLLQMVAETFGHAVIEERYLAAVEEAMCADVIESATARGKAARRKWKGGR